MAIVNQPSRFQENAFWGGQPLATLEQNSRAYYHELMQLKQLTSADYCLLHWQCILSLVVVNEPSLFGQTYLSESELIPWIRATNDLLTLYFFYLYKLTLAFLFGEIDRAETYAVECRSYLVNGAGFMCESAFYLYDSLIAFS